MIPGADYETPGRPDHWNGSGKCLICNDTLGIYDSKYVAADKSMICTAHRVKDWQARGVDFKAYRYWTDG